MREIKFRAWLGNRMEYQVLSGQLGNFFAYEDPNDKACCYNTKYTDKVPVMQFTGLKDKNGKEIYEGDIYKTWYSRDTSDKDIVEMIDEVTFDVEPHRERAGVEIPFLRNAEIIGNIYENADLLK